MRIWTPIFVALLAGACGPVDSLGHMGAPPAGIDTPGAQPSGAGDSAANSAGGDTDIVPGDDASIPAGDEAGDAPALSLAERCFSEIYDPNVVQEMSYDQFNPVVGSHCLGTDHQQITGIERVVFLGDSVTAGTPPTPLSEVYRVRLAEMLAVKFGLDKGPPWLFDLWRGVGADGPLIYDTGDFSTCAKWGARTDDIVPGTPQISDCFPESKRGLRTLVIQTVGGNDISKLTKDFAHSPYEDGLAFTQSFVADLRAGVEWLKEPGRFPNGIDIIFGNMFEFTDGTGDTDACTASTFASFEPWDNLPWLVEFVIWANEQYMSIAVDTGSDMIFMLESFCGHGFKRDDQTGRCYRGPDRELWFDLTCIHPNPLGHQQIADMFMAVVNE